MAAGPVKQDVPEDALVFSDDSERVLAYRTRRLMDLDFTIEQVDLIVHRADVAHDAERLLGLGASHEFVVDQLRD